MTTPLLLMDEWTENQDQPHIPVNGMARTLEVFASFVIVQSFKEEPDDSNDEEEGDAFLVLPTGTGTWAGHDNEIAYYSGGLKFVAPREGMVAWVIDTFELLQYTELNSDGAGWYPATWAVPQDSSGGIDIGPQPYVAGSMFNGEPTASLVVMRHPLPFAVTFLDGLPDSQGYAGVAATAQTDFDLQKDGVSFGTMRFAAAGTVATFIMSGDESFVAGEVLEVIAPGSPDATLADIGFSLVGER